MTSETSICPACESGDHGDDVYRGLMACGCPCHKPLAARPDREHMARIDAQRCTLEFAQKLPRADSGARPMDESPLFGGQRQASLFGGEAS